MKKTVIIILGPTAIGKTSLSITIANHYKTEIISADSRQIFKELSIGTAIPDSQQLNTVKHHLVQNHSIHEYYNASNFEMEALEIINSIFTKKDLVVMTGGSMLYIDTFCNGIDDLPTIDPEIRKNVINKFEEEGIESIRHELKKIDPEYYQHVDLKNYKRILHALEVYYMTGKKYSSFRSNTKKERDFGIIKIGLNIDRKTLHERINARVDKMIEEGLIEEARNLIKHKHLNSLNTVGYKELFDYFDEKISLPEAIDLIKRNTRRYARKQLTWFNRDTEIDWFTPDQLEEIIQHIDSKLISDVRNSHLL
jgi:tRNA dimethylallyltransferase